MKNISFFKGKKGTVLDILFVSVIIFAFSLTAIIGVKVLSDVTKELNESFSEDTAINILNDNNEKFASTYDFLFLLVFVGLFIMLVVSVVFIRVSPAFFGIVLVMLFIFLKY